MILTLLSVATPILLKSVGTKESNASYLSVIAY
jgi:hypothetical protein